MPCNTDLSTAFCVPSFDITCLFDVEISRYISCANLSQNRCGFGGMGDGFDLVKPPSNNRGLISGSMDGFWSLLLQVVSFKVF
ncbi:MAG TPA: hypothetical protein VNB68_01665 [Nitrososphaeraceae archaeon]|nr:hypothetical protein [Nitrososphaeraceae archaeon]